MGYTKIEQQLNNYKKNLESNRGSNYEYWGPKHDDLLNQGWELYMITDKSSRQWSRIFKRHSTSSEHHAKKYVEQLRSDGNYARIVCGYNKNKQRIKMYSIIYKPKCLKSFTI